MAIHVHIHDEDEDEEHLTLTRGPFGGEVRQTLVDGRDAEPLPNDSFGKAVAEGLLQVHVQGKITAAQLSQAMKNKELALRLFKEYYRPGRQSDARIHRQPKRPAWRSKDVDLNSKEAIQAAKTALLKILQDPNQTRTWSASTFTQMAHVLADYDRRLRMLGAAEKDARDYGTPEGARKRVQGGVPGRGSPPVGQRSAMYRTGSRIVNLQEHAGGTQVSPKYRTGSGEWRPGTTRHLNVPYEKAEAHFNPSKPSNAARHEQWIKGVHDWIADLEIRRRDSGTPEGARKAAQTRKRGGGASFDPSSMGKWAPEHHLSPEQMTKAHGLVQQHVPGSQRFSNPTSTGREYVYRYGSGHKAASEALTSAGIPHRFTGSSIKVRVPK